MGGVEELTPEERATMKSHTTTLQRDSMDQRFGMHFITHENTNEHTITSLTLGSPSTKADLRSGDEIIAIDGQRAARRRKRRKKE